MEEIEVGCRIGLGGGATEGPPFVDEVEGVLLRASDIEARGREPELASAGAGLDVIEDVSDDNNVPLGFGVGGLPVVDGALGVSMDPRRDGGGGGLLEDAIVDAGFTGEFAEGMIDFLKVEGVEVVVFDGVGVAAGVLLLEAPFVTPDPNAPEFNTFAHMAKVNLHQTEVRQTHLLNGWCRRTRFGRSTFSLSGDD